MTCPCHPESPNYDHAEVSSPHEGTSYEKATTLQTQQHPRRRRRQRHSRHRCRHSRVVADPCGSVCVAMPRREACCRPPFSSIFSLFAGRTPREVADVWNRDRVVAVRQTSSVRSRGMHLQHSVRAAHQICLHQVGNQSLHPLAPQYRRRLSQQFHHLPYQHQRAKRCRWTQPSSPQEALRGWTPCPSLGTPSETLRVCESESSIQSALVKSKHSQCPRAPRAELWNAPGDSDQCSSLGQDASVVAREERHALLLHRLQEHAGYAVR